MSRRARTPKGKRSFKRVEMEAEALAWLEGNMGDDTKQCITLLSKNGIKSMNDLQMLSKQDLDDMGLKVGPRNRFLAALSGGGGGGGGGGGSGGGGGGEGDEGPLDLSKLSAEQQRILSTSLGLSAEKLLELPPQVREQILRLKRRLGLLPATKAEPPHLSDIRIEPKRGDDPKATPVTARPFCAPR